MSENQELQRKVSNQVSGNTETETRICEGSHQIYPTSENVKKEDWAVRQIKTISRKSTENYHLPGHLYLCHETEIEEIPYNWVSGNTETEVYICGGCRQIYSTLENVKKEDWVDRQSKTIIKKSTENWESHYDQARSVFLKEREKEEIPYSWILPSEDEDLSKVEVKFCIFRLHSKCTYTLLEVGRMIMLAVIKHHLNDANFDEFNEALTSQQTRIPALPPINKLEEHFKGKDVLFLYEVIARTKFIPSPKNGWGKNVDPFSITPSDDVERIHQMRNKIVRDPNTFSEGVLRRHWHNLMYLVKRIDLEYNTSFHKFTHSLEDCGMGQLNKDPMESANVEPSGLKYMNPYMELFNLGKKGYISKAVLDAFQEIIILLPPGEAVLYVQLFKLQTKIEKETKIIKRGTSELKMDVLQEGTVRKWNLPDHQKPMSRHDKLNREILRSQSLPIIGLSTSEQEIDVLEEGTVLQGNLPDHQKPLSRHHILEAKQLRPTSLPIIDFGTSELKMDVLQEGTVRKGNLPDHQKPMSKHDILEREILRSKSLPKIGLSSSNEEMDYLQEAVVLEENLTDDQAQTIGHDVLEPILLHFRPTPKLDFGTSEQTMAVLQRSLVQKMNLPDHKIPMSNHDVLEKAKLHFQSTNLILAKDSNKEKRSSYSEDKELETVIIGFSEKCYISEVEDTEFHGIKVYLKHPLNLNSDTTNTSVLERKDDKNISEFDENLIVNYIGANDLWESHSNLRIISCDSYKYTAGNILEKTCLVLYCRWKGFIPLGENPFPKYINYGGKTIDVDVREGYFQNGVLRGVPFAYNNPICMGSSISESNSDKTGSIGLFVQSRDKKSVGFLTCSHVLLDCTHHAHYDYESAENDIKNVIQPSKSSFPSNLSVTANRICGKIETAKFHSNIPKSVDVALVKVTERMPNTGHFVIRDGNQVSDAGFNEESFPQYHGQVMRNIPKSERYRPCFKSGTATGFTRGQLKLRKMEVYIEDNGILLGDSNSDGKRIMKGQYEVSTATSSPFFSPGDSGAAVFLYDTESKLNCIGIAIGTSSYGSTIVTPIGNVLDSLGLTDANVVSFPPTEDNEDNA